jgi:hypothetical protein
VRVSNVRQPTRHTSWCVGGNRRKGGGGANDMTTLAKLDGIKRSAVPTAKQDQEPAMSRRSAALLALVAATPAQLGLAARGPTHG